jgi:hypothetical protein
MKWLGFIVFFALWYAFWNVGMALESMSAAARRGPNYHYMAVAQLANKAPDDYVPTHVLTDGWATYVNTHEDDGDTHIRVCTQGYGNQGMDRNHCIVTECIPEMPCAIPRYGERITVCGITRYDSERNHGWWEIHPRRACPK